MIFDGVGRGDPQDLVDAVDPPGANLLAGDLSWRGHHGTARLTKNLSFLSKMLVISSAGPQLTAEFNQSRGPFEGRFCFALPTTASQSEASTSARRDAQGGCQQYENSDDTNSNSKIIVFKVNC